MTELEKLCRQAYGAYEYLRDNDFSAESGTSKRLRSGDLAKLRARLAEELNELKGVIEGTHFHEGFDKDIVLEGYEVWYWAASLAVAQQYTYEEIKPHAALESGFNLPAPIRDQSLKVMENVIKSVPIEPANREMGLALFQSVLRLVGMACALNQTPPSRLLERDIDEMRQKNYLAAYWQQPLRSE